MESVNNEKGKIMNKYEWYTEYDWYISDLLRYARSYYLEVIQEFSEDQSNIIINNFDLFLSKWSKFY